MKGKIDTDISLKATNSDTTVNFYSNYPTEHKMAAYRYCMTLIHSLPLLPLS